MTTFKDLLDNMYDDCLEDVFYTNHTFHFNIEPIIKDFAEKFATKVIKDMKETGSASLISDKFYQEWLKTKITN